MWSNFVKKLASARFCLNPHSLTPTFSFLKLSQDLIFPNNKSFLEIGLLKRSHLYECKGRQTCILLKNHVGRSFGSSPRSYGSVAEVVTAVEEGVSTGDEVDEVQELRQKNQRDNRREEGLRWTQEKTKVLGLRARQVQVETEAWEKTAEEYQELLEDMCKLKLAPNLPYMKSLFLGWFEPLCTRIEAEQELCQHEKSRAPYASYFYQLPADKMAVITMHKLVGLMMKESEHRFARVTQAACIIGEAIEQEVRLTNFLEKAKRKRADKVMESEWNAPDTVVQEQEKLHKKVNNLMKKQKLQALNRIVKGQDNSKRWSEDVQAQVGSRLIELLLDAAYIQPPIDQSGGSSVDIRPAFFRTLRTANVANKRRFGAIECDPLVRKGLERNANHVVIPYMPMLVPPVKWRGYDKGGYLFLPSYVMRARRSKQQRAVVKSTPKKNLKAVFQALDTLGSTRWRLNKRVLSVVERIWSSGGGLAHMVDFADIPLPEKPDTDDEALLRKWRWRVKTVKKDNAEKHSLRCDTELKLSVARKLKEENCFFYPHNVDFRGRAYPMHPHLNHLGSDVCRGILEFGEGRRLGKSGLNWLKIHLANLFAGGVDKLSLEGRIAFTENHLEDIFDSADRPLEGRKWWLNAEDPFQCLAVCINLTEALRSSSPEATISHIPVHQDGSCNGLQHYAALGRDKVGAVAVNLVKGEKPADVYSGIAARVLDIMRIDAQKDPSVFPEALRARILINQVDRKLVKQTVMTSVYGVTYIGARDQIKRRLKERGAIADEELFGAACYAAKITLTALGEMFEAARSIMSWLGDCAKVIASDNQPVQWITPLGLPVVQPYRELGSHIVKTSLQSLTLQRETGKVLAQRQRTAFPPNFIHSLDGTHMMMTAVACKRAGLNFAGVHDSYWTHACDVDEMNVMIREKFVELYETPILENLLESFQKSFPALVFPPLPERGEFDLKEVLESTYFFN